VVIELSPKGRVLVQRLIPIAKKLEQTRAPGCRRRICSGEARARRMYDNLAGGD